MGGLLLPDGSMSQSELLPFWLHNHGEVSANFVRPLAPRYVPQGTPENPNSTPQCPGQNQVFRYHLSGAVHFGTIAEGSGQPRGDCPYRMGQWATVKYSPFIIVNGLTTPIHRGTHGIFQSRSRVLLRTRVLLRSVVCP